MKKSLRKRIAVTFILIMAMFIAMIGVFEYFSVDGYYMRVKMRKLVDSYDMANEADSDTMTESFNKFANINNLTYGITDPNISRVLDTNSRNSATMSGRLFGVIMGKEEGNYEKVKETEKYSVIRIQDRFAGIEYLELYGTLDNGDYYLVLTPAQSIAEAAQISVRYYLYLGFLAIVIGAISIWFVTKRIVEPILELNSLSKRMADLDFDAHYTSGGEDEIGELGKNFNVMSDKLETAVSDLKSANAKLERDIAEKIQIDEMRKEFLGNVSHELKTPIALIQGYAEGLKDNVNDDPESRDFYCDVIIDESKKMNHMVRQLLTLNQLENGNDQLSMERFELVELINGAIAHEKLMIEQKKAKIILNAKAPIYVWGDEFKIEEVVTNYLTNALNHLEGDDRIEITCTEQNGIVTTTVFNSGQPIPEESLDKIWEKFYKVYKARTRAYGGSGIGLSIVKAIMDAHQQKCWATNYRNGVAFSFTLESKVEI